MASSIILRISSNNPKLQDFFTMLLLNIQTTLFHKVPKQLSGWNHYIFITVNNIRQTLLVSSMMVLPLHIFMTIKELHGTICLFQNPGKYQANLSKSGRFGEHFIKLTMKYFWRTGNKKKRLRSVKWHSQCNCFAVTYLRQLQAKSHSSQASSGRLKKETISQTGLGMMQQIHQIWWVSVLYCIFLRGWHLILCSIVAAVWGLLREGNFWNIGESVLQYFIKPMYKQLFPL